MPKPVSFTRRCKIKQQYRLLAWYNSPQGGDYMNLTPVSSSNISAIGYEGTTLYVRFNSGALYAYYDVPESLYRSLMSASSHGSYLDAHVKKAGYRYAQVG